MSWAEISTASAAAISAQEELLHALRKAALALDTLAVLGARQSLGRAADNSDGESSESAVEGVVSTAGVLAIPPRLLAATAAAAAARVRSNDLLFSDALHRFHRIANETDTAAMMHSVTLQLVRETCANVALVLSADPLSLVS